MRKAAEAVTQGHPDKICDQIADAIVDEFLRRDQSSSVNVRVLGSHGMLMIGGDVRSSADFDLASIAKQVYADIGCADDLEVFTNIHASSEPGEATAHAAVVNGYATRETREMLPRAFVYATNLARRLDDVRKTDPSFAWLMPDGKAQVVTERDRVTSITLLAAHAPSVAQLDVQNALVERVVTPLIGGDGAQFFVNPLGAFTSSGLSNGAGVSGSKLSSDTYGGLVPHGDSSFSGKDPSRPERAGAYLARMAARWLVTQGLASSALVTAVYAPGRAEPVHLEASGVSEKSRGSKMDYTALVKGAFDFRVEAIVERLGLRRPIYRATAAYGQFGRVGFPWEEDVK